MLPRIRTFVAGTALLGLPVAATQAGVVFVDHFNNGVVADSDNVAGFWTVDQTTIPPADGAVTAVETAGPTGQLTITTVDTGVSGNVRPAYGLISDVSSDFAFDNAQGVTYSFDFDLNTNDAGGAGRDRLRFWITDDKAPGFGGSFDVEDAVTVDVLGADRIDFGWKNGSLGNPFANQPGSTDNWSPGVGNITGFDLTLTDTSWELVVNGSGGTASQSGLFADDGGLTNWGASSIGFHINEIDGGNAARTFVNEIDRLEVTAIPEPGSLGLALTGAGLILVRRRQAD
jgi:hypothetical protein